MPAAAGEPQPTTLLDYDVEIRRVICSTDEDVMRAPLAVRAAGAATESPVFSLVDRRRGVDARAQLIDREFTILSGSTVVGAWTATATAESTRRAYANYPATHEQLVAEAGIIVESGAGRLGRDIRFGSRSTAGAVTLRRSCNSRREWIDGSGISYGEWENREIAAPADHV